MRTLLVFLLLAVMVPSSYGADDSLGGASKPKPQMSLKNRDRQYKRIHQFALRLILLQRLDEAEDFLGGHLQDHPADGESFYMLGLLHAARNQRPDCVAMMKRALDLGLPAERIVAGPRDMLQAVKDDAFFKELADKLATTPLHGPMVGNVTDSSASIWVRTARESTVRVVASLSADLSDPIRSPDMLSAKSSDFTAVITVNGLKPDTVYYYRVVIDGRESSPSGQEQQFRTFPPRGAPCTFKIAFGGGAGFVPPHERMWNTIGSFQPLAILLLGDNTYIDDPESVMMQLYTYYRRQSRPEFRQLTASTAVFSIWDDHDFGTNDCWGGPLIEKPFWKKDYVYPIWRQNWPNPGFGGDDAQPGCWYTFSIGDVDFVMLDCRYYRTNPRQEDPSMLGPAQLDWLKRTLRSADGTFKVICSSVPWDFRTKGDSRDTWNGYQDEREEIFQFIEANNLGGVLLMSADRHRSDAWRIDRDKGYGFYEFNSSRLTNQHVHPTMEKKGAIFSYNAKQSFGLVEFDTTASDPTVTYTVINIDGEKIHDLTVDRSEL